MANSKEYLDDISEIRSLMERNTKFLSLSGLSGISAGICALVGAFAAWIYLDKSIDYIDVVFTRPAQEVFAFFALDSALVFVAAISLASFFSIRMARKRNAPVWNKIAWLMLVNLAIPLATGGLFCIAQVLHGSIIWVPSTMLIFYGMALLNASKYTLPEIRYLAVSELVLGLACAIWVGNGLIFWAVGFGLMHIIYGTVMFYKYER